MTKPREAVNAGIDVGKAQLDVCWLERRLMLQVRNEERAFRALVARLAATAWQVSSSRPPGERYGPFPGAARYIPSSYLSGRKRPLSRNPSRMFSP